MGWNRPLTLKMKEYEKETGKHAVYNNKITGNFEFWMYWRKDKIKKPKKSIIKTKKMEKELITMALKQIDLAEKERRLNPAQKRRRQELKSKLKIVDIELKKLKIKEVEPINIKDKRPLKEFHYLILKALKETPNITQRNIYIEDKLVKKFPKFYLEDLVAWGYATKSKQNKYSITRQGKWKLKQLKRKIEEDKRKAKLREYRDLIKKLDKTKKELPLYEKKLEDIQERDYKLRESISEITEKEWDKHRFDYTYATIYDKETKTFSKFKWSNPKEAKILISMETRGSRYIKYRKAYNDYYDRVSNIERYEKLIKKFEDKQKGLYKKEVDFRNRIDIEIQLSGVLKALKNNPNDRELKILEKKLRKELRETIDRASKRKRMMELPFN